MTENGLDLILADIDADRNEHLESEVRNLLWSYLGICDRKVYEIATEMLSRNQLSVV